MLPRIARVVVPVVGCAVVVFGALIPTWVEYRREVLNWSTAWALFDVAFGLVVLATWIAARRGHWVALALAGATNALQGVDIVFSLLLFYDLSRRPFIVVWACVLQPLFAVLVWAHVKANVPIPPRSRARA